MIKRLFALAVLLLASSPRAYALPPCAGAVFNNGGTAMFGGSSCEHSPTLDHPVAGSLQLTTTPPPGAPLLKTDSQGNVVGTNAPVIQNLRVTGLASAGYLSTDSAGNLIPGSIVPYAGLPIGDPSLGQTTGYIAAGDDGRFTALVDPREFGANGDGTMHVLGLPFFGSATQIARCPELPATTTATTDDCGLQGAYHRAKVLAAANYNAVFLSQAGAQVHVSTGIYMLTTQIVVNDASVRMVGDCQFCAHLVWNGVTDGIWFDQNPTASRSGYLGLENIWIDRLGFGGVGIRANFQNTHPTFDMTSVTVGPDHVPSQSLAPSAVNAWATPILISNGNNVVISHIVARSWPGQGGGDLVVASATPNSITFTQPLINYTYGQTLDDLTNPGITFTGSITGTTLTVTSPGKWPVSFGNVLSTSGTSPLAAGTVVTAQLTGDPVTGILGGNGTYSVNIAQNVASESLKTSQGIPDACTSASISGSTITTACPITVQPGEIVRVNAHVIEFYAPATKVIAGATVNAIGHFNYAIKYSNFSGGGIGCIALHANSGTGIQGVTFHNLGCGNTNDFVDLYDGTGGNPPSFVFTDNDIQVNGDFCHCENGSQIKTSGNNYALGAGATGALHPLTQPNLAMMWNIFGNGQENTFTNNLMGLYPGAPPLSMCMRASGNHFQSTSNSCGYGSVSLPAAAIQLQAGAANFTSNSDAVYTQRVFNTTVAQVAGDTSVTVAGATGKTGWTLLPTMIVSDTTNPLGLNNCAIKSVVINPDTTVTVNLPPSCPIGATGVAAGDALSFTYAAIDEQANWVTAFQRSPAGTNVIYLEPYYLQLLQFNGGPNGLGAGMAVTDLLNGTVPYGCQTTSVNIINGQVGLSCNITADILPGYVFNFQGTASTTTAVLRNAPLNVIQAGQPVTKLSDNYNDLLVIPVGAQQHDIYADDMPIHGQNITILDKQCLANQYPFVWHDNTGAAIYTMYAKCGSIQIRWASNGWTITNINASQSGNWTPSLDALNHGNLTFAATSSLGTYTSVPIPSGGCKVTVAWTLIGTPTYNGTTTGYLKITGLPFSHSIVAAEPIMPTLITWPAGTGASQIEWDIAGSNNFLTMRAMGSGLSGISGVPITTYPSGTPVTLNGGGSYTASGC